MEGHIEQSALALVADPGDTGHRSRAHRVVLDDAKPAGSFRNEEAAIRHGNDGPWTLKPFKDHFDLVPSFAQFHDRNHRRSYPGTQPGRDVVTRSCVWLRNYEGA